jgi:HAMP domain-containing protein
LLSPQPAPDCEFRGANVEAMDATELVRLKIEYERRCYQNAEKAARDRLGLLQGAVQRMRN